MGPHRVPRNLGDVPVSTAALRVVPAAKQQRASQVYEYPTVLVARDDDGLRPLVDSLQRNGFHILEADNWEHLFDVVRVHSRPIHLLLADVSMDSRVPILKEHRSELQVLFVKKPVDAEDVLTRVRQLLGSPPSLALIR